MFADATTGQSMSATTAIPIAVASLRARLRPIKTPPFARKHTDQNDANSTSSAEVSYVQRAGFPPRAAGRAWS